MKKSSPRRNRVGIFHGQTTVLALGMLLVAVIIVSFFFIQQMQEEAQIKVKGLMTQNFQGLPGILQQTSANFPIMMDPKLTCITCSYITHSSTPNVCLNNGSSTVQPYAHCATTTISGETCASCPAITPYPTTPILPTPPPGCYYKKGICPMIACKVNPDGTTWCPPCRQTLVCPTGTITQAPIPVIQNSVGDNSTCAQKCINLLGFKFCVQTLNCAQSSE